VALYIKAPSIVKAAGSKSKIIEEYFGVVNSRNNDVSIARMKSPSGWIEPGQTPEFTEFTVVLKGVVRVLTHNGTFDIGSGEAVMVERGEWVQYSTPGTDGAEYISVCLPAFSPSTDHRDSNQ
jgi:mannose-6-phosphate isomerase-like protein (cupin superfamily)